MSLDTTVGYGIVTVISINQCTCMTHTCGVLVLLCGAVVHLNYGHAEIHPQSVHVEETQKTKNRQRVSRRHPREKVHSTDPMEERTLSIVI